jgi:hypothetical protein
VNEGPPPTRNDEAVAADRAPWTASRPGVLFAAEPACDQANRSRSNTDIDRAGRVAYVNRSLARAGLSCPKTAASIRAVFALGFRGAALLAARIVPITGSASFRDSGQP